MGRPIQRLGRVLAVLGFIVFALDGTLQSTVGFDVISPAFAQDENWARQHHSNWLDGTEAKGSGEVATGATAQKSDV